MLISKDEIQKSISNKGWNYDDKKLKKSYKLKNFSESMKFVNEIAIKADTLNHHPEININFNKLGTNNDFYLAESKYLIYLPIWIVTISIIVFGIYSTPIIEFSNLSADYLISGYQN